MERRDVKDLLKEYEPNSDSLRDDCGFLKGESTEISQNSQIKAQIPKKPGKKQLGISQQQEIIKLYSLYGSKKTADLMHIQYERVAQFLKENNHWVEPANSQTVINKQINQIKTEPIYEEILKSKRAFPEAYEFCKAYLNSWGNNAIKDLAKKFKISEPTVVRLRNKAGMPLLYDLTHPGYKAIKKRIKKLYINKDRSTIHIAKIIKTSPQYVQNVLHDLRITMKPSHIVNSCYFKTKSHLSGYKLLQEIKRLYEAGTPLKHIAEEVGVWEGTVSSKLTAMGVRLPRTGRIERNSSKGHCVWCGDEFTRYISKGPKRQIFCNNKCKNKCKDMRRCLTPRMIKGKFRLPYENRFRKLALEFVGDIEALNLPDNVKIKVNEWRKENGKRSKKKI